MTFIVNILRNSTLTIVYAPIILAANDTSMQQILRATMANFLKFFSSDRVALRTRNDPIASGVLDGTLRVTLSENTLHVIHRKKCKHA